MDTFLTYLPYAGWVAMVLSLTSTFSRTMIPLRFSAAASNIVAIVGALASGFWPNAIQNTVQLPMNLYRLAQMKKLIADVKAAPASGMHAEWLQPFADARDLPEGTVLFRKGDQGDRLYFLASGTIRFQEIGVEIGEGTLFGEIAFFTKDGIRTQTAECVTPCRLLSVEGDQIKQLYFQNPEFGWYLIQLIAQRLTENATRQAGGRA